MPPLLRRVAIASGILAGPLVARDGVILHASYAQGYDERALATSFSVAKSFVAALVGLRREREPGTLRHYASSDALALGLLIARATGRSASAYLEEAIWVPAGMESPAAWS